MSTIGVGAVRHDPFDDLEAAGVEREVEQHGVRAEGAHELHGLLDRLGSAEHLDAGHLQQMAEAGESHVGARDDDGRDRACRFDRRAHVGAIIDTRPPHAAQPCERATLCCGLLRQESGGP